MRAAVAAQHFGRVIRAYRFAFTPPVNQTDMADQLGVGQSQVSRIERGGPPGDLRKLQRWATTLEAPDSLLWFRVPRDARASHATASPTAPHHDQGDDDVHRRDALKLAGAAVLSATPWQRITETDERGHRPDRMALRLVQDRTTEFFRWEETTPSRTILTSLIEHGRTLDRLLEANPDEQSRRRLLSTAGETEALAGWCAFDLSRPREAVPRYRRALAMAAQAGDGPLTACTLNYWSYLLASRDRSDEAVKALAEASTYVRGSAATTQTWISGRQAEEAASIGDHDTAERALERAFTATTTLARAVSGRGRGSSARAGWEASRSRRTDAWGTAGPTRSPVRCFPPRRPRRTRFARWSCRISTVPTSWRPKHFRSPPEASLAQDRLWELTETLPQGSGRGTAAELRQHVTSGLLAATQA